MRTTHRCAALAAGLVLVVLGATGTAGAARNGTHALRRAQTQTAVDVPADTVDWFVDSGVALRAGEVFSIASSGTANWDVGDPAVGPAGLKFTRAVCAKNQYGDPSAWANTGLNCYSLVGKIGDGPVFLVGPSFKLKSPVSGELYLGFNDDYPYDNSGDFVATITTP
jgi:hypothetical protein